MIPVPALQTALTPHAALDELQTNWCFAEETSSSHSCLVPLKNHRGIFPLLCLLPDNLCPQGGWEEMQSKAQLVGRRRREKALPQKGCKFENMKCQISPIVSHPFKLGEGVKLSRHLPCVARNDGPDIKNPWPKAGCIDPYTFSRNLEVTKPEAGDPRVH